MKWVISMKELSCDILQKYKTIIVELTNYCNLSCSMCYIQRKSKGWMSIDLFKKIIDELHDLNDPANMFLPFWKGESLLHPQFDDMIEYFIFKNKDYRISSNAGIDTNGLLLDNKKIDTFLHSGHFSVITFSVDAFSEKTYKLIRGGDRNTLYENIKNFLKKREKVKIKRPSVVLQYIVMEQNIKEVDEFLDYWICFFKKNNISFNINWDYDKPSPIDEVTIMFRPVILPLKEEQEKESQIWNNFLKKRFNTNCKKNKADLCGGPFTHIVFNYKGEVFPCCVDTDDTLIIGDIKKESLKDIINGKNLEYIRQKHILGKKTEIIQCKDCVGQVYPVLKKEWLL